MFWKYAANLQESTHANNKVALQLCWNHPSAGVLSCKFAAYFQNAFSQEYLWVTGSEHSKFYDVHLNLYTN